MSDHKGYVEFFLGLYAAQLKDCSAQYPALSKEFERDLVRLRSAVESHGVRFLLDTMPTWRKHFDQCLANGRLTRSGLLHFSSWKRGGTVPKLFRGLVLRVFDLKGELKPDPDHNAVATVRQLLGVARRFRLSCGVKENLAALRDFIRTDQEVRLGDLDWDTLSDFDGSRSGEISLCDGLPTLETSKQGVLPGFSVSHLAYRHAECIQQVADYISSCLGSFNPQEARFRHGPGALSDRPFGSYKYEFTNWPDRLDEVFPMADFAIANYDHWFDSSLYNSPTWETRKEYPAKLCCVPKTIKTPRLIASEPDSLQWCQQSVRDFLYTRTERSCLGAFVDFNRQELNGQTALQASHTGELCTIDLSSASDRISCWLVERIFRRSPSLLRALGATRSKFLVQDIGGKGSEFIRLRKFSTMGNATTFPVQSLVFLAISLGTLIYIRDQRISREFLRSLGSSMVRVFGDDIIVPKDCAGATVDALHAFGLKVNASKTFVTGKFRESCGVDAFDGHDVTTVSVLDAPNKAKPGTVVSSVDVHNNFVNRGYYYTAAFIQKTVRRVGLSKIQHVAHGSGSFGWYPNYISPPPRLKSRYDADLQLRMVRCLVLKNKQQRGLAEGVAAALQFFTEAQKEVKTSESSLGFLKRRVKSTLTLGWVIPG